MKFLTQCHTSTENTVSVRRSLIYLNIAILLCCCIALTGVVTFALEKRASLQEAHRVLGETVIARDEALASKAVLVRYIVAKDIPNFSGMSDIEKVVSIRNWAIQNLPIDNSPVYDLPFPQVLVKNLSRERGVWCGGSSYLLAQIYNSFGFDAVSVSFGLLNSKARHAMTAVKVSIDNDERVIIQDGYMGVEYLDDGKNHADIFALTHALRQKNTSGFSTSIFLFPSTEKKVYLNVNSTSKETLARKNVFFDTEGVPYIVLPYFQERWTRSMEERISEFGKPQSMFSYLLVPFGIGGENAALHQEIRTFYEKELGVTLE